jgi:hypothetical protein
MAAPGDGLLPLPHLGNPPPPLLADGGPFDPGGLGALPFSWDQNDIDTAFSPIPFDDFAPIPEITF